MPLYWLGAVKNSRCVYESMHRQYDREARYRYKERCLFSPEWLHLHRANTTLKQWFPTFLMLGPFNTVPHVMVT